MADQIRTAEFLLRDALQSERIAAGSRPQLEVSVAAVRAQLATAQALYIISEQIAYLAGEIATIREALLPRTALPATHEVA